MANQMSTNGDGAVARREASAASTFRDQFKRMETEIGYALPQHIPVERFMRVVLTAVNESPDLLDADRRSLLAASLKAAQDGLLPDGRDGALVVYNTKTKVGDKEVWIKKVQWMPMMGGLLKKARNSGEIRSIEAHVVREGDKFTYILGDNPRLEHEPNLESDGALRFAYAIAWLKDGTAVREVMTRSQIAQVRSVSKSSDGPAWKKWEDEMWRKAAFRRLSKWLPKSSDLDDLIRRDDKLYDFGDKAEEAAARAAQVGMFKPVANPLADDSPEQDELPPPAAYGDEGSVDPETGEIEQIRQEARGSPQEPDEVPMGKDIPPDGTRASEPEKPGKRQVKAPAPPEPPTKEFLARAKESGASHGKRGIPYSAMPREFSNHSSRDVAQVWHDAYEEAAAERRNSKPGARPPPETDLAL